MKRLICLAVCLCWAVAFAQKAPTEVSLVVSADGPTKTEAVNNALRSAIEQSVGTFVSANTEILNEYEEILSRKTTKDRPLSPYF